MKKYEMIYNDIANQILQGKLKLGGALDSEISYQKKYEASRFTVRNAISKLENEGYIQKSKGKPSIVINNVPRQKNILFLTQFMGHYLFANLVYEIEKALKAKSYNIIISFSYSDKLREKQNLENLFPIADGIIIDPTQTCRYHNQFSDVYSKLETKPSVTISAPLTDINIPSLITNDFDVMQRITKKIVKINKKSILLIARDLDYQGSSRLNGILSVLENNDEDISFDITKFNMQSDEEITRITFENFQKKSYDTVMFFNDQCAYPFIELAEKHNLDLSNVLITGFDGIENTKFSKKIVSPIYPTYTIAADVASTLINLFDGKQVESKVYELEILNEHLID